MSKFARRARPARVSMLLTNGPATTHEGGGGAARDPKSELFLLAASNMSGEETFYELGQERDVRFRQLIKIIMETDASWVDRFVPYLRNTLHMRSAAVAMAAEYARNKGPAARAVINSACARPDEPAELLGYWLVRVGRKLPKPVKRGLADAARRMYDEKAALKWDSPRASVRMADVIELCHVKPGADWQSELFQYLIDHRHNRPEERIGGSLKMIRLNRKLEEAPAEERRVVLRATPSLVADGGITWERLSGWLPGGMDAEAWGAVIPKMGVMALLRNLRNFDDAGVSDAVAEQVAGRIADPEAIERSRVFPIRFFAAFKAVQTLRWGQALERGIVATLANVPRLKGRTLVMVDNSGSMADGLSARSSVSRAEVAGLFGAVLAVRCEDAVAVAYDTQPLVSMSPRGPNAVHSILKVASGLGRALGGTNTWNCTRTALRVHGAFDRVIVITDEQAHDAHNAHSLPGAFPVYTLNVGGYAPAHTQADGRFVTIGGGMTDAAFTLLSVLDDYREGKWPF